MAISSNSKMSEIIADPRAKAIMEEYSPGFADNPEMGPVLGMKFKTLLKFPQTGLSRETIDEICARIDALDA